jgi:hypothetical protein
MRKRYLLSVAGGCVLTATRVINAVPVNAQVGNYGCGSSTAAGSGGLPTTGLTNIGTLGYGLSTGAGPAATATGPTNSGSAAVPAHGWGRNSGPRRVERAGDRPPLSNGDSVNADIGELDAVVLREDDPHGSPLGSKGLGELAICRPSGYQRHP